MLTMCDIEGEADGGTLGMNRVMSATDDMLIASSSTRELAENSCIRKQNGAIIHQIPLLCKVHQAWLETINTTYPVK